MALSCGGVGLLHIGEHLIPKPAATAEGFLNQFDLLRAGVEAELDDGVPRFLFPRHGSRFSLQKPGEVLYNLTVFSLLRSIIISAPFCKTLACNQKNFKQDRIPPPPGQIRYNLTAFSFANFFDPVPGGALARGIRFGPERLPMPKRFEELAEDWWNGRVTAADAGRRLGVSRKTFTRRAEEWVRAAGLGRRGAWPCAAGKAPSGTAGEGFFQPCRPLETQAAGGSSSVLERKPPRLPLGRNL